MASVSGRARTRAPSGAATAGRCTHAGPAEPGQPGAKSITTAESVPLACRGYAERPWNRCTTRAGWEIRLLSTRSRTGRTTTGDACRSKAPTRPSCPIGSLQWTGNGHPFIPCPDGGTATGGGFGSGRLGCCHEGGSTGPKPCALAPCADPPVEVAHRRLGAHDLPVDHLAIRRRGIPLRGRRLLRTGQQAGNLLDALLQVLRRGLNDADFGALRGFPRCRH